MEPVFNLSLSGHDDEVSLYFSLGFDRNRKRVGPLEFYVTEESISQATGLPRLVIVGSRITSYRDRSMTLSSNHNS